MMFNEKGHKIIKIKKMDIEQKNDKTNAVSETLPNV